MWLIGTRKFLCHPWCTLSISRLLLILVYLSYRSEFMLCWEVLTALCSGASSYLFIFSLFLSQL